MEMNRRQVSRYYFRRLDHNTPYIVSKNMNSELVMNKCQTTPAKPSHGVGDNQTNQTNQNIRNQEQYKNNLAEKRPREKGIDPKGREAHQDESRGPAFGKTSWTTIRWFPHSSRMIIAS